jgi:predicted metalloprotease
MQMDGEESSNIEDRRGEGGFGGGLGGGGFGGPGIGIPLGGGLFRGGFGLIAIIVISLILGINPLSLLGLSDGGSGYVAPSQTQTRTASRPATTADPETQFVARVLKSTEDFWGELFQQMGKQYRQPRLVLFRDATQTACGTGQSAMGPFYCPNDRKVYLDLAFWQGLGSHARPVSSRRPMDRPRGRLPRCRTFGYRRQGRADGART